MELHIALKQIISQFGEQVLEQRKLVAFLADYEVFHDGMDDSRRICKIIDSDYASRIFSCLSKRTYKTELGEIESEILASHPELDSEQLKYVLDSILFAYGKLQKVSVPKNKDPFDEWDSAPVPHTPVRKQTSTLSKPSPKPSRPSKRTTIIKEREYCGRTDLTTFVIPDGTTEIGPQAFYGCKNLESVTIPEGLRTIGYMAFYGCEKLKVIHLPDSVKTIGERAFSCCHALESVNIPEKVTAIEERVFYECPKLSSINIPKKLKTIGDRSFYGCHSLTSVNIPDTVVSVGEEAFYDCPAQNMLPSKFRVTSSIMQNYFNTPWKKFLITAGIVLAIIGVTAAALSIVLVDTVPVTPAPAPVSAQEPEPVIEYHTIRERRYYQWDESVYKVDISFRCPTDIEGEPLLPLWEGWLHDKELRNDINRIVDEWSKDRNHGTVNYKQLYQEICKSSEYIDGILLNSITISCFGKELLHELTTEQKRKAASADLTVREQIYIPHKLLGLKQTVIYGGEVDGLTTTLTRYIYYYIPWERTLEYSDIFTLSKQQLAEKLQSQFIAQYIGSIRIDWERFINDPNVRVELQKSKAVLNLSTYAMAYDGDAPIDDTQPSVLIELPYIDSPDLWGNAIKQLFLNAQ